MHNDTEKSLPVALEQRVLDADLRMNSPSAARNAEPILKVFKRLLRGRVLEIGCGTGEHAVYFAEAMPRLSWLPTDPDGASRASTASWIRFKALTNVLLPLPLDASAATWDVETLAPFDAVVSINMVHIAPWVATLGLLSGAGRLLRGGGLLLLYGPFLNNGVHNAPSNATFDESLKELNPSWGLRDIAKLEGPAGASGLQLSEIIEMPANNRMLVFHRGG